MSQIIESRLSTWSFALQCYCASLVEITSEKFLPWTDHSKINNKWCSKPLRTWQIWQEPLVPMETVHYYLWTWYTGSIAHRVSMWSKTRLFSQIKIIKFLKFDKIWMPTNIKEHHNSQLFFTSLFSFHTSRVVECGLLFDLKLLY